MIKTTWRTILTSLALAFALARPAGAQLSSDQLLGESSAASPKPGDLVKTRMIADHASIKSGDAFRLGVLFKISPKWHIYYKEPGEIGLPTKIEWKLPDGFKAGELQWPEPKTLTAEGITSKAYEGEVLLFATVTAPPDLGPGETAPLSADLTWLVCKEDGQCIPGEGKASLEIRKGESKPHAEGESIFAKYAATVAAQPAGSPAAQATPNAAPAATPQPTTAAAPIDPKAPPFSFLSASPRAKKSIFSFLLLAFAGGLLLNIMPCVLPVLSIKILSFVRQSGEDRRSVMRLGLFFTLGVLCSFALLAILVAILQGAGKQLGWGFQFQEPRFLVLMCAVVFAFGLSLFGVFELELPGAAMQGAGGLQRREGPAGAFFNGVLATALATPCTAPLLGPALGVAFAQPAPVVFLFFMVIGMGMSTPYLLLAAFPGWLRFLPRPGNWMIRFKELMGFLLMATVVWLLWVLGRQAGNEAVSSTLAFLTAVALACWLLGIALDFATPPAKRIILLASALIIVAGAYWRFPERDIKANAASKSPTAVAAAGEGIDWEPFDTARIEALAAARRTIFLDFTADWCLTCKVNERTVLARADVQEAFKKGNVAAIRGDYTRQPPEITRLLRYFGRSGVPMYVVIPANHPGEPTVLPEVLTPSLVIDAIEKAAGK